MVSSGRSHLFRVGFDLSGSAMALPKESLCCIDRSGAKVDSDFMAATAEGSASLMASVGSALV